MLSKLDWPQQPPAPPAAPAVLLPSSSTSSSLSSTSNMMTMMMTAADLALNKARRESASQIDEFFEEAVDDISQASSGGGSSQRHLLMGLTAGENRDWDDITTSLSKIDPDNADMLELCPSKSSTSVKMEPNDDSHLHHFVQHQHHQQHQHQQMGPPSTMKTNMHRANSQRFVNYDCSTPPPVNTSSSNNNNNNNGFLPPTPPSSDPGSPSHQDSQQRLLGAPNSNKPPPPSYATVASTTNSSINSKQSQETVDKPISNLLTIIYTMFSIFIYFKTNTEPLIFTVKYNRRNNPELEKRRIHHCDFPGCTKVYTKSSHLKAHQRIHTGSLLNSLPFIMYKELYIYKTHHHYIEPGV